MKELRPCLEESPHRLDVSLARGLMDRIQLCDGDGSEEHEPSKGCEARCDASEHDGSSGYGARSVAFSSRNEYAR